MRHPGRLEVNGHRFLDIDDLPACPHRFNESPHTARFLHRSPSVILLSFQVGDAAY
ncbi:hypothetical protein ASZ90_015893 [hydrocarbon metagenome]|uniref:Uncharacterized protein n=1 Tax=hydrocarbon metagenome TaxID=938273 RepID=A0A0W8F0V5_9ZZZZ